MARPLRALFAFLGVIPFLRYFRYVFLHKLYVFQACCKLGVPLLGIVHDLSKFLPDEWGPYQRNFYQMPAEPRFRAHPTPASAQADAQVYLTRHLIKAAFDVAWLLHQRRNKHHWQFWLLYNDDGTMSPLEMPERYVREMIADWSGAGRAITGTNDVGPWYWRNRDKMLLHAQTRSRVELLLGVLAGDPPAPRQPTSFAEAS